MQLGSVVYVSKHRFKEFTKQTWTSLLFDLGLIFHIYCEANWESLFYSTCTTTRGAGCKMVAEGNMSSESYWKPLISFCRHEQKAEQLTAFQRVIGPALKLQQ